MALLVLWILTDNAASHLLRAATASDDQSAILAHGLNGATDFHEEGAEESFASGALPDLCSCGSSSPKGWSERKR